MSFKVLGNILLIISLCSWDSGKKSNSGFSFRETIQGVELLEGTQPVYFYQKAITSPNGNIFFNNYIHPLYSLDGDTLTEVSPKDHLHHRGIFWAWHQILVDTAHVGDSWMMKDLSFNIQSVKTKVYDQSAQLDLTIFWESSVFQNGKPFVKEHAMITVQKSMPGFRIIDFEIRLTSLVPNVSIGGSEDEKGYGGFSARIKLPEDLVFTSEQGPVSPQNLQIQAGQWMDFSASFNPAKEVSGFTILCHPETPNYVPPWILRQQNSMQNIVFPGREKVKLVEGKPLVLRYRMIVHKGRANETDLPKLQSDYSNQNYGAKL
jgi:hypothetical protein